MLYKIKEFDYNQNVDFESIQEMTAFFKVEPRG